MSGYFYALFRGGWVWGMMLAPTNMVYRKAITMSQTAIVITQVANGMVCRTSRESVFKVGLFTNRLLLLGIIVEIALQAFLVYTPMGQAVVNTTAISPFEWLFFVPFALLLFVAEEGRKAIMRKKERAQDADIL